MKFTVTPLGGAAGSLARVVDGIVRYLSPPPDQRQASMVDPEGPSRYYADGSEEPGRWLGRAAQDAGLMGTVERDDFATVLAGRDPHTGERLVTAQGSASRRPTLGVGTHSAVDEEGRLLFSEADTAVAFGVTQAEVGHMLDIGTGIAASRLLLVPGRVPGSVPGSVPGDVPVQPEGSFLVPVVAQDGSRSVPESELSRCALARDAGTDPAAIEAAGDSDDLLPLAEAARLAGVTAQYLRRAAKHYEDHGDEIALRLAAGRHPRRAFVIGERDELGHWLVRRRELAAFVQRRRPRSVRVGFDVTLTTEKSLGVLALLGNDDVRDKVLGAIRVGNDWAIRWLEQRAAIGRVGGTPVPGAGWTVASFRHLTSRALDPFPHHHNVVANTVLLPDGSHRALDARGLYRHAAAASALATAEMRSQLTAALGVRWRRGRKGTWEIDGIPSRVLREFSKRRNEIDEALHELEEAIGRGAHPAEIEHIVLRTRPAKQQTSADELVDVWRQRADDLDFDAEALSACCGREPPLDEPDRRSLFAALAAPDGICATSSVFTRADALVALANQPLPSDGDPQPLLCGAARLESLTDEFLDSADVVTIGSDPPLFTTAEMLAVQDRIVTRYRAGHHRGAGLAQPEHIDTALAAHEQLTDEQQALVRSWYTSGHQFQAAIGRAGTGKTTTVAAAARAWETSGYRVIGAAVKGEAARTLATTTGIDCETVAWYLAHEDPASNPLDARTVLVVDEASTLADRDLDQLMTMTAAAGATLRLIGDPAQHGAIPAGGMFRVLGDRYPHDTPELAATHRVRNPQDRAAADALREGRIDDALDRLEAAGHLHMMDDELATYRHVLARWWDAHRNGLDHPMVDRRNTTRRQLNRLAHILRQVHGEVGTDEIVASGDRRFALGDRITARAPSRDLHVPGDRRSYVRNGALGTVIDLHHGHRPEHDTITVAFDGIGTITLPRNFFDHHRTRDGRSEVGIDHAYALTSYAVQGSTSEVSTSRLDATATRAEAYVDITRGRQANHLYLTSTTDPLDGEALPRLPPPPADAAIASRLERSRGELTAWELANPRLDSTSDQAISI